MTDNFSSGFHAVQQVLEKARALVKASESHAMLCGMACSGTNPGFEAWFSQVLAEAAPDPAAKEACQVVLGALYQDTLADLYNTDMEFQPLLPDDASSLDVRLEALGTWCEGFLFGLGIGGMAEATGLTDNLREILRDFGDISKVRFEIEGPVEDAEQDFVEIVEYVRAAVLLVLEELRPSPAPARLQ